MQTQILSNWGTKKEKKELSRRKENKDVLNFNFVKLEVEKIEHIFGRYSDRNNIPFDSILFDD